jgi:chromate transporter
MDWEALLHLVLVFGPLSLMAVGGTNTILPEMHLRVVHDQHWLTERGFADVFAIAQAAPGPSTLIVTLIGYRVAGLAGAVTATLAMTLLPLLLTYGLTRVWEKASGSKWRSAIEHGLAPITVGLVFASGLIVARAADHSVVAYVVTAMATLVFAFTKIHPLLIIALCGALGLMGWV